jgi:hypothetical protein
MRIGIITLLLTLAISSCSKEPLPQPKWPQGSSQPASIDKEKNERPRRARKAHRKQRPRAARDRHPHQAQARPAGRAHRGQAR